MHYDIETWQTLLSRGRDFMRARRDFVRDPGCVASMIMACIEDGATTRNDIIRTIPKFVGHRYADVAWQLDQLTGPCPEQHVCFCDESKAYRLHAEGAASKLEEGRQVA
jgi:hypothetical protein